MWTFLYLFFDRFLEKWFSGSLHNIAGFCFGFLLCSSSSTSEHQLLHNNNIMN
jgi:hypothetical protein